MSWGTIVTSVRRSADRRTGRAGHGDLPGRALARLAAPARWACWSSCSPPFPASSTACGACSSSSRRSSSRSAPALDGHARLPADLRRARSTAQPAGSRPAARGHDPADDHGDQPGRLPRDPEQPARRRPGTGCDAMGDGLAGAHPVRAVRVPGRDHPRPGPRAGRDDRGDDGHRQQPRPDRRRCSTPATRWPRSSPTSSPRRRTRST